MSHDVGPRVAVAHRRSLAVEPQLVPIRLLIRKGDVKKGFSSAQNRSLDRRRETAGTRCRSASTNRQRGSHDSLTLRTLERKRSHGEDARHLPQGDARAYCSNSPEERLQNVEQSPCLAHARIVMLQLSNQLLAQLGCLKEEEAARRDRPQIEYRTTFARELVDSQIDVL